MELGPYSVSVTVKKNIKKKSLNQTTIGVLKNKNQMFFVPLQCQMTVAFTLQDCRYCEIGSKLRRQSFSVFQLSRLSELNSAFFNKIGFWTNLYVIFQSTAVSAVDIQATALLSFHRREQSGKFFCQHTCVEQHHGF